MNSFNLMIFQIIFLAVFFLCVAHFLWLSDFKLQIFVFAFSFFYFIYICVQNGEHAQHIILEYTHLDKAIVADLFLNQNLLTQQHFLRSQNADGSANIQTFNRSTVELCHYQVSTHNFSQRFLLVGKGDEKENLNHSQQKQIMLRLSDTCL